MLKQRKPRVLYLVYWGASEPLGQSLVLPAVRRLAALGAELTLVTFEKPADLERREQIQEIKEALGEQGVRWVPLKYHKWPKVPATMFDIAQACARAVAAQLKGRFDIIHARTFIGGLAGLALAPILRARFIYHNEGFYPDEQVDAGVWALNSRPHRVAKFLEWQMYQRADGVIALSQRAKAIIENLPLVHRKGTPVIVVPSCVNLEHFRLPKSNQSNPTDKLKLVYVGSAGGRYRLDRAARFVSAAQRHVSRVQLQVLTQTEPGFVRSVLSESGLPESLWSIERVPHAKMPERLASQHAGLHFLNSGLSEHGGSPTKIGEYWASGLPVVTTPNVSDVDEIIRRERVGVIVKDDTEAAYEQASKELCALLADEQLEDRCRRAAETYYALEPACERQMSLYRKLISPETLIATSAQASKLGNS